jgi:uncharacterized protein YuzE
MKMTYDGARNIAYLRFQEKQGQVTTLQISEDLWIDIGEDGRLYGIELLNANEQLAHDHGQLIFESPAGRHAIALSA